MSDFICQSCGYVIRADCPARVNAEYSREPNPCVPVDANEITRLRARVAELEVQLEQSRSLGKLGGYPCTPEHTWAEWVEDRHKRVAELEVAPSINIAWIGGNCPVQAEGTVGGEQFYFRARGDAWSFGVGVEPVGSPGWEITAPFGEDFDAGWMDVEQARSIVLAAAALYSVAQVPSADTPKVAT